MRALFLLCLIWGASIFKDSKGKKIHYEWEVNKREDVKDCLLALGPYLMLKRPQCMHVCIQILQKNRKGGKIFVLRFRFDSYTKRQVESGDGPLVAIFPDFEWIVLEAYLHACIVWYQFSYSLVCLL